jgi:RND family efflux transporter MFP subunit
VEPYAGAALYAKVSGELMTLNKDIGDPVSKNEVLAEIKIPERIAQRDRSAAKVAAAEATLQQTIHHKAQVEAEVRAANAAVKLAQSMVEARKAFQGYRQRQYERIKQLVATKDWDKRLLEEQTDYLRSSEAGVYAALVKVDAERKRAEAARARSERVDKDIEAATADIAVAKAELAESQVWVDYGTIRSPYDGVVTQRGYLRGDFIRAGELGGNSPVLTVITKDVMRVVVPVPDRDVPFIEPGKTQAFLTFDALPTEPYPARGDKLFVSRRADAEAYQSRLMRVEVDVPSKDGKLEQGMFGQASLILTDGAPGAVHIPTEALSDREVPPELSARDEGYGKVRVVRDGKIQTIKVKHGTDNGVDVEILAGSDLTAQDQVVRAVVRANAPVLDGSRVTVIQSGAEPSHGLAREKRTGVKAEVITPKAGGIPRRCIQPGSAEPKDGAALFAKVSGQLKWKTKDIGERVSKGEVLAEIDIPELKKQLERDTNAIEDAKAKVEQTLKQQKETEAELLAARLSLAVAGIMVDVKTKYREYRQVQLARYRDLLPNAADEKEVDRQEEYYLEALEEENSAREKANAEKERVDAASAKRERVHADLNAAIANVAVARAEQENSKAWVDYGTITSPYDGVITQRGFLKGDFIKAAEHGGNTPILTVMSTKAIRVVVQVPERDVPFIKTEGNNPETATPAILTFTALPDVTYKTRGNNRIVVSRMDHTVDFETRLMRVEVDVPNDDGKLQQGMFGRATLILTEGTPGAIRIPSSTLVGRATGGKGTVRVVRDGKIQTVPVRYGMDDGIDVEILSGVTLQEQVVMTTNVPVTDGMPVSVSKVAW